MFGLFSFFLAKHWPVLHEVNEKCLVETIEERKIAFCLELVDNIGTFDDG